LETLGVGLGFRVPKMRAPLGGPWSGFRVSVRPKKLSSHLTCGSHFGNASSTLGALGTLLTLSQC